ncbi:hypothetical protein ABFV99_14060 [Cytobacillus horneckiae]|uniref:hypothetical protein n=1 Tax=Cytobacillus horneckiae TaxID=549687 RepID=UPI0034CF2AC5
MNNFQTGFQGDVINTANNMMTQMMCAEKGIDYNQLIHQAQQSHINNILHAEQQRQINNLVKRHYQGQQGGFMAKLRDAFSSEPQFSAFAPGMPTPTMPVPQPMTQPAYQAPAMTPAQSAQFTGGHEYEAVPIGEDDNRLEQLEQQMKDMQLMLQSLAGTLNPHTK